MAAIGASQTRVAENLSNGILTRTLLEIMLLMIAVRVMMLEEVMDGQLEPRDIPKE